jgi:hypothetical protein
MPAAADEGMWLLSNPPSERLQRDHHFQVQPEWIDHLMKASVRFNNGGSGSFVSRDGLVVTNHHIGADSLQKLSRPGHDLLKQGFYAHTSGQELRCPDLELNVLQSIEDVTARVQAAVKPGDAPEDQAAARRGQLTRIEKESQAKLGPGWRSDVVTLFQGGAYHLYRYRRYTDVRLVMAPEQQSAFFGGDVDNFEFPRFDFDVCFFRIYENGRPIRSEDYFPWSQQPVKRDDLVFVIGHPGRTDRLDTMARLQHLRDHTLPFRLAEFRMEEASLRQFADRGLEQARLAQAKLYSVANARKSYTGQYYGLLDHDLMQRKQAQEDAWRKRVAADPKLSAATQAWARVAEAESKLGPIEKPYDLVELRHGLDSRLFLIARHLVRMASELAKPNEDRLREYRDSNLQSLRLELFSPAPISSALEKARLTSSLAMSAEQMGGDDPLVTRMLGNLPPDERAEQLVGGCTLFDVSERKRLASLNLASLRNSNDPMIQLAFSLDEPSRLVRERYESDVEEPEHQAYAQIARAEFAVEGNSLAPDATFTLRLAYGTVRGYPAEGRHVSWFTTLGGLYEDSRLHGGREPFQLPSRWLAGKSKLDLSAPFDFVSTADTIGGNSGSPVVGRDGKLVGINFDRNRFGLVRNFVYSDKQARQVAVSAPVVLQVLTRLYDCKSLVAELTAGHR